MSGPFGSSQWMYSSGGFYPTEIEQSLRFNDGDSAYLNRSFSAGDSRTTWTLSLWLKLGDLTSREDLFSTALLGYNEAFLAVEPNARLRFYDYDNSIGAYRARLEPAGRLRDPSAWYHIVITFDTTNATSSERCRMYINGVRQTEFDFETYPSQNYQGFVNAASTYYIGRTAYGSYLDGYLAEVNFIDGQALDPTDFGEFKSGVWVAKEYAGSYGTNGFYLDFSNSGSLGADSSGNGNNWTANNLAATDQVLDSPTNNFCTMSPLWKSSNTVLEDGNLYLPSRSYYSNAVGTMGVSSGKWYFEARVGNNYGSYNEFGVVAVDNNTFINQVSTALTGGVIWHQLGKINSNGTLVTNPTSPNLYDTSTKIVGCALDLDNNKVYFRGNGTWIDSSDPDTDTGGTTIAAAIQGKTFVPLVGTNNVSASPNTWINFGQDGSFSGTETAQGNTDDNGYGDFYYAPPSGYLALCTANLPDPVIDPAQDDVPSDYFNSVIWTGDTTTKQIPLDFTADFVWAKRRNGGDSHVIYDIIRGENIQLSSNSTAADTNNDYGLDFLGHNYLEVDGTKYFGGGGGGSPTFVAWNWLAGNGTSSNTDGSITSTVSVNQKAGFSIVSYTGNATSGATVGHGLGAAPAVIIVKNRDDTNNWNVYHHKNTSAPETDFLILDSTNATADGAGKWNDTAPTTSVFTIGSSLSTNTSGDNLIAYCFAEVEGYSKFGSYTGNGSSDGPFVYCGFRPAFVMVKRTDVADSWVVHDGERDLENPVELMLFPDLSSAELGSGTASMDFLSNGFKLRVISTARNASGGTYIYMAFAENPFKYANAR